ncbi:hypothetical protein DFA_11398 [Cavenderia fasciculata]|uniref:DDE Tnp4 domain-containing protein n=1 Tax=Cavenderia fasciculata TaxID=261658 RepID=F4QCQ5_CACFS|nr:uncharacterized protein DFA_11398 [Cavenderia fasciculata]EGG13637.1 hypothetical protein DFA_11398 [Cavenderia fasciculata]|eukprot:XP_004350341.1 hypothetical protein DFA_11398 [Cavenderia fasciculata]
MNVNSTKDLDKIPPHVIKDYCGVYYPTLVHLNEIVGKCGGVELRHIYWAMTYFRQFVPFSNLATNFNVSIRTMNDWVNQSIDELYKAIKPRIDSFDEVLKTSRRSSPYYDSKGIGVLTSTFVETTKPSHPQKRTQNYYEKHDACGVKFEQVISLDGQLVWIKGPFPGSMNDNVIAQTTNPLVLCTLNEEHLLGDRVYQGFRRIVVPHKKRANVPLTTEQKERNEHVAQNRVVVDKYLENLKVFGCFNKPWRSSIEQLTKAFYIINYVVNFEMDNGLRWTRSSNTVNQIEPRPVQVAAMRPTQTSMATPPVAVDMRSLGSSIPPPPIESTPTTRVPNILDLIPIPSSTTIPIVVKSTSATSREPKRKRYSCTGDLLSVDEIIAKTSMTPPPVSVDRISLGTDMAPPPIESTSARVPNSMTPSPISSYSQTSDFRLYQKIFTPIVHYEDEKTDTGFDRAFVYFPRMTGTKVLGARFDHDRGQLITHLRTHSFNRDWFGPNGEWNNWWENLLVADEIVNASIGQKSVLTMKKTLDELSTKNLLYTDWCQLGRLSSLRAGHQTTTNGVYYNPTNPHNILLIVDGLLNYDMHCFVGFVD